ncbi:hypothetical protein F4775DRAFT_75030 [Biscogniauxia sp. FL1348]|nr:hypothetical protein F4775DRAFT_75030 [Biscogniauxia sp. FL1348]
MTKPAKRRRGGGQQEKEARQFLLTYILPTSSHILPSRYLIAHPNSTTVQQLNTGCTSYHLVVFTVPVPVSGLVTAQFVPNGLHIYLRSSSLGTPNGLGFHWLSSDFFPCRLMTAIAYLGVVINHVMCPSKKKIPLYTCDLRTRYIREVLEKRLSVVRIYLGAQVEQICA